MDEVRAAIPDEARYAASCGLRLAVEHPNSAGWYSCFAFDRSDRTPSASIHRDAGVYWDGKDGRKVPFFALLGLLRNESSLGRVINQVGADVLGPRTRAPAS